jgi:hypothetical protein
VTAPETTASSSGRALAPVCARRSAWPSACAPSAKSGPCGARTRATTGAICASGVITKPGLRTRKPSAQHGARPNSCSQRRRRCPGPGLLQRGVLGPPRAPRRRREAGAPLVGAAHKALRQRLELRVGCWLRHTALRRVPAVTRPVARRRADRPAMRPMARVAPRRRPDALPP